jgi:hypothetical protein
MKTLGTILLWVLLIIPAILFALWMIFVNFLQKNNGKPSFVVGQGETPDGGRDRIREKLTWHLKKGGLW